MKISQKSHDRSPTMYHGRTGKLNKRQHRYLKEHPDAQLSRQICGLFDADGPFAAAHGDALLVTCSVICGIHPDEASCSLQACTGLHHSLLLAPFAACCLRARLPRKLALRHHEG